MLSADQRKLSILTRSRHVQKYTSICTTLHLKHSFLVTLSGNMYGQIDRLELIHMMCAKTAQDL